MCLPHNLQCKNIFRHRGQITVLLNISPEWYNNPLLVQQSLKNNISMRYLESSEMWSWRKTEISWTDSVRNEEVWHKVEKDRNILCTIKRRKDNWTGHTLPRNCLLKHVTEERQAEGWAWRGRRGRRRKQLLYDNEMRGYWKQRWNTRSHSVENSLWNRLRTCRKTDYSMTKCYLHHMHSMQRAYHSIQFTAAEYGAH